MRRCAACNGPLATPHYSVKGVEAEYCSRRCLGVKHTQFATNDNDKESAMSKKTVSDKAKNITTLEKLKAEKPSKTKTTKKARAPKGVVSAESKGAMIVSMIQAKNGATLEALAKATGWKTNSVRGFISGHVGKKLGLKVESFREEETKARTYRIAA